MPKPKKSSDFEDIVIENKLDSTWTVTCPAGAKLELMSQDEVNFYNEIAGRYQSDNKFTNISDLLELDRLLMLEVMTYRWSSWITKGCSYDGSPINPSLSKDIQTYSKEIRDVKGAMGIDKKTRESMNASSAAEFIEDLKFRGKEFGIHRDNQIMAAYNLLKEAQGKVTLYRNSTPEERTIFQCHEGDIIDWLEEKFAEFDKIDEAFRKNQKLWVREELND
jgi:hypothetical protein